jgi:myo-inositol-1(or 4)-monophosphatase
MKPTLINALESARKILLEHFGRIGKIEHKHDQSNVVTAADIASEREIIGIIRSKFPSHNIIAEESGFIGNNSEYTWAIDPLDGTSNFAAGLPWFGIIICLLKNNEPILAGVSLPITGDVYIAEKGKGATRNGAPIHVTWEAELRNVLVAYGVDFSSDKKKQQFEKEMMGLVVQNARNLRSTNSILDTCFLADGRIGGRVNLVLSIWEAPAEYLMITEAGGIATPVEASSFDFSDIHGRYTMLAGNAHLHAQLKKLVSEAKRR